MTVNHTVKRVHQMARYFVQTTAAFLLLVVAVFAPLGAAQAQEGLAVLSPELAIQNTDFFREKALVLQQDEEFKALVEEHNSKLENLRELQQAAERDAVTMTEAQMADMQTKFTEHSQDLKVIQSRLEKRQQALLRGALEVLNPHLRAAILDVIKARGIKILINRQSVLHADELIDITDDVAKVVNRLRLAEEESRDDEDN